jgi:cytochrome c oxidase cbb3-type subunit 3
MKWILTLLVLGATNGAAPFAAQPQGRGAQSPASQRPTQTVTPQTYTAEQVKTGETRFASQCGFCHGRDAAGGESGPDLTRSRLVAEDVRGDKIAPVLRSGRTDKGMPAFTLSDADLTAIVAYIHDQKSKAETQGGGRRAVDVADLQTGNAEAGKQYFNGAGGCARCHSPSGDLAGVGARYQGLALLQRMLYPSGGRGGAPTPKVTVTFPGGATMTGKLAYRDEFTISLIDSDGWRLAWPTSQVKFTVDEPLSAHFDQLAKYTDNDMHNVFAYLQTLK